MAPHQNEKGKAPAKFMGEWKRGEDSVIPDGVSPASRGESHASGEIPWRQLMHHAADAIFVYDLQGQFLDVNEQACRSLGYSREELLKMKVSDVEENFSPEKIRELINGRVPGSPRTLFGVHRKKDGDRFPVEIRVGSFESEKSTLFLALVRDISDRQKMEQEIKKRFAIEKATADISRMFVQPREPDFNEILKIVGETVSANRAYVFQFRESGSRIDNTFEWCDSETLPQIGNLQDLDASSFSWWMGKLRNGEMVFIPDVELLPKMAEPEREILKAQGIQALLAVPIHSSSGDLIGFLGLDDTKKSRQWSGEDAQALIVISEMMAIFWERKETEAALLDSNRRLENTLERVEQLSQRILHLQEDQYKFISRELHDNIAQTLYAVKMRLEKLERDPVIWKDPTFSDLRREIHAGISQLGETSREIRKLSKQMRPEILDQLGLFAALEFYIEDFGKRTGIATQLILKTHCRNLPTDLEIHAYRIVLEALNNVAKHAKASHAVVSFQVENGEVFLAVKDNGIGFLWNPSAGKAEEGSGIGIVSMQERVNFLRGEMEIRSGPQLGTTILIRIPLYGNTSRSWCAATEKGYDPRFSDR